VILKETEGGSVAKDVEEGLEIKCADFTCAPRICCLRQVLSQNRGTNGRGMTARRFGRHIWVARAHTKVRGPANSRSVITSPYPKGESGAGTDFSE